jgi:hypothetical protein
MTHTLNGISEEKFAELKQALESRTGIVLERDEGTVEKHGFCVRYRRDSESETLSLELLKKPWFVPQSLIDRKVGEYLTGPGRKLLGGER